MHCPHCNKELPEQTLSKDDISTGGLLGGAVAGLLAWGFSNIALGLAFALIGMLASIWTLQSLNRRAVSKQSKPTIDITPTQADK